MQARRVPCSLCVFHVNMLAPAQRAERRLKMFELYINDRKVITADNLDDLQYEFLNALMMGQKAYIRKV